MQIRLWLSAFALLPLPAFAQRASPPIAVSHAQTLWTVAGHKQTVTFDATNLSFRVQAGATAWDFFPSEYRDLRARSADEDMSLRLADAQDISVARYDTGYQTGLKVTLTKWRRPGIRVEPFNLTVYLTLALEGPDEDLVCTVAADEKEGLVRQLDWPGAVDAHEVDDTVLPNGHGALLPRNWPKEYNPILPNLGDASALPDTSIIQSNLIECWSMSWWGFERGTNGLMAIVETPNDAAYQFRHPPGGPTIIGPRWRSSLGRLSYRRSIRFCFLSSGGYVAMAKRYRQYVIDRGQFVSLREKIARSPAVARLIGNPETRLSILHNLKPGSYDYAHSAPEKRHVLHTFDERIDQLRKLKADGLENLHVTLTGWPNQGYDRQHPDELPPSPEAGGYEGLARLAAACKELGYVFTLHDQYRDYYPDAASYDSQFAIHEEDPNGPPLAFPGTRYGGGTKEGTIPFLDYWEGGKQTYLSPDFMLGHLVKNYTALEAHGIHPDGAYLDVFGYVPPDEDYNPEHPTTRTRALADRALCFNWVRSRLGIVGTEAGSDWTVPYADYASPVAPARCIDVPLFELVYHDALITPFQTGRRHELLRGILNAGLPQIPDPTERPVPEDVAVMSALNRRLAQVEMTGHRFLDPARQREETRFADGTTITVDWTKQTYAIDPPLPAH